MTNENRKGERMATVRDASGEFLTISETAHELAIARWRLTRLMHKAGIETQPLWIDDRARGIRRADVERLRELLYGSTSENSGAAS